MARAIVMKIPNGVTSSDMKFAALQDASGRLCALDLQSGRLLGKSEHEAVPLLIHAQRIFGYRCSTPGAIDVFAYSVADADLREIWSTRIPVPDWIRESGKPNDGLAVVARVNDVDLVVNWHAQSSYHGGAPPPMEIERTERQESGGIVRLSLDDGGLVSEEATIPSAKDQSRSFAPPELPPGQTVVAYRDGTALATHAWQAPVHKAFLSRAVGGGGMTLMHELGETPRLVRNLTDNADAEATVTADGKLIFVREGTGADTLWRVFSADNADEVASLPFDQDTVELASNGELVFVLTQEDRDEIQKIVMHCRTLASGELIWSFALGERIKPLRKPFPL